MAVIPSATNTWVPNWEATGQIIAFCRNPKEFRINDYVAFRPAKKPIGLYLTLDTTQNRRVTAIDVYLNRTGATIDESGGNILDTVCCTLPSGWRPTHDTINGGWDSGVAGGGFVVGIDGICTLRSATGDVSNGSNLRLHVIFIKTT